MKKQVVRAGKYMSVGILFIACLPVLLPLLFFLSIFGFTFVLPLGCALAGFLYLRKYVGMLYRKLPFFTLGGCPSWGRRPPLPGVRPGPPSLIDWPLRDQQAIETFESVDPEFDAVVISTVPREEERGSVGDSDGGANIGAGPEAVSVTHVPADDDTTRREGGDADKIVNPGITVGDKDHETITREETDDGETAEKGLRKARSDDDVFTENRTRTAAADGDISADNRTMKERLDVPNFAENGTKREEAHDDISPQNETRIEVGEDHVFATDGTKKGRIGGRTIDDNVNGRAGIDEHTSVDEIRGGVREIDTVSKNRTETQGKDSISVDETRGHVPEVDVSAKDRTETAADNEKSFEALEDFGRNSGVQEIEERSKQEEINAKPDGSAHPQVDEEEEGNEGVKKSSEETKEQKSEAVPNECVLGELGEGEVNAKPDGSAHPQVDEEEEGNEGVKKSSEETKGQKSEALPNECVLGELGEDQHGKSVPSVAVAITPDTFDEAENESPTKPDGVGLLPHQANEDDIWMCKECGWKYPNAKPSAKIRRNHKKHCKGSSPRGPASEGGIHAERLSQDSDGVAKLRIDSKSSHPLADSNPKRFGEEVTERKSSAESDMQGGKFISDVKADDSSSDPSARGMDPTNRSKANVTQDAPGPVIEQSLSAVGEEERIGRSPSRAEDDEIRLGHEHHSQGVDSDSGGTAISSGQSGEHDEELGVAKEFPSSNSESFRSAPDEFPHDRWSSFHSAGSHYDDEQDQLAQVQQELQLCDDLNAVKGVVGDKHVTTGPLLSDIEELSQFLGIDLPVRSADLPEIEWAKLAIEVMKVVVGID